jgi:hypothetical protein
MASTRRTGYMARLHRTAVSLTEDSAARHRLARPTVRRADFRAHRAVSTEAVSAAVSAAAGFTAGADK